MRKFLVTSWNESAYQRLLVSLHLIGVKDEEIVKITKRESRGSIINRYIKSHCSNADYIYLLDEDITLVHVDLKRLESILDAYPKVGLVSVPSYQFKVGEPPSDTALNLPPDHPLDKSLKDISGFMDTFNLIAIKKKALDQVSLDNDIWGSQMIDIDLGWELFYKGFYSVADCTQGLIHNQTDFSSKNLFYHAAVSRNRHIALRKWTNRNNWQGVDIWNENNNNEIPSLEELAHSNEYQLITYIARFDRSGLLDFYFKTRFTNNQLLQNHISQFNQANSTKTDYNLTIRGNLPYFV